MSERNNNHHFSVIVGDEGRTSLLSGAERRQQIRPQLRETPYLLW